ncbi:MAG: hypothetical protein HZA77_08785 [Candidatus Schekmanbacteria bacterium]|nr:hypothetical protein [Candidatus Schekmanbacteria bacterium]
MLNTFTAFFTVAYDFWILFFLTYFPMIWNLINTNIVGTFFGAFLGFLFALYLERLREHKESNSEKVESLQNTINMLKVIENEIKFNFERKKQINEEAYKPLPDGKAIITMPYYNLDDSSKKALWSEVANSLKDDPDFTIFINALYRHFNLINRMLDILAKDYQTEKFEVLKEPFIKLIELNKRYVENITDLSEIKELYQIQEKISKLEDELIKLKFE